MTRKPKWQEQVEEKIERALEPSAASARPSKAEEREPDFLWAGRPVFRCRICRRYERVENLAAVLEHERSHAGKRESSIVGADGKPLIVEEA